MDNYNTPERILDLLAIFGLCALICVIWEKTEVMCYGFSQSSIVDSFFAVVFSLLIVAGLRTWAIIKHEEV